MKFQYLLILIIFFCLNITSIKAATTCIQGQNCPNRQGYCYQNECICVYGFVTFYSPESTEIPIYCNYKQNNRIIPLFFEFILPPTGLIYLGKIKHAFIKLILIVMIFICKGLSSGFTLLFALLFFLLQIVDISTIAVGAMKDGNGIPLI